MGYKTIVRIFAFAKPYRLPLAFSVIALLLVIIINLFAPLLARALIDNSGWNSQTALIAITLAAAYLMRGILKAVSNSLSHVSSLNTCALIQTKVYERLQNLSRSFYSNQQSGELLTRMTNDVDQVEALISHALPDTASNILLVIGVTTAMFAINVPLAATAVATILPLLAVGLFQGKVRSAFRQLHNEVADQNATLSENLQGIREIQLFNRQRYENERVKKKFFAVSKLAVRAIRWYSFLSPGIEFFTSIGQVVVIAAGGYMTAKGELTSGDVVAFLLYIGLFYGPVAALSNTLETIQRAVAGASRAFEMLEQSQAVEGGKTDAHQLRGEIEFDKVSFSYEDNSAVLDCISFGIPSGQTVALIGETGAGKTTLLNLIIRLFDPQRGSIRIDGVNVREYTLESLRNNISIVSQDVFLFSGTIYDNIAYSKPDATPDEVCAAASYASIHDFIMSLSDGYGTVIGEKGVKLSGGQRQRLAIARAILRNTPILLLDEATSAVDEETEREIRCAVKKISTGKTVLIVTHRLASISDADRVISIKNGRIVSDTLM